MVSSRATPAIVKSTLTSARSLLGPDAYELLITSLTATRPSPADIAAALAEVRPFAVEHEKERRKAKLRLVQSKRVQQGKPQQSDQLQPQLDERAITQLQRAINNIAKYINTNTSTDSTPTLKASTHHAAPPSPRSSSAAGRPSRVRSPTQSPSPTRLLLQQLSALLPPLHFQALLRCFLVHSATPLTNLKLQERHLATVRDIVAATTVKDDKAWQLLYGQYKGLRRREALDERVCAEMMKEVDEVALRKLLPQAKEMEKSIQERRSRSPQQTDTERTEVDKREKVKEREAAAEQERARLTTIMDKAACLSLPIPAPLPAYFPGSPIPIDAAALPSILLPPAEWTVAAMRCLEQLQAECHPLTYWHFRSYMALLAAGPATELAAASSASAVLSSVTSYCSLLFPESRILSMLSPHLPTFLLLPAPLPLSSKRALKPSPALSSLPSVPSFDLPLERHVFLCHFHREVVPAQSSELFLAWWRWQLSMEEAERRGQRLDGEDVLETSEKGEEVDQEASAEMKGLDEEISRLQRRKRGRRTPVEATEAATIVTTADVEKKASESKPRKEVYSRMTVLNTAVRLFGDSSPLVFLLRQHITALTYAEWSEVRLRLSVESEHHDYIGFFVNESSSASASPLAFHQRYNNQLLESNPSLVFVHSPAPPLSAPASSPSSSPSPPPPSAALSSSTDAFSSFRSSHSGHKLFLTNLPPDMSARELMFALRRIGDVKGGELFREKQRISSTDREMMAEREKREKAAASPSSALSASSGRKGQPLKVLKVANDSPVYAAVYFSSAAALLNAQEPSLHLFGLHYRGHSMYPLPSTGITRITLASPTLRHSFSFGHLVSHIVSLLVPSVLPSPSHVSIASRATLSNNGYVTLTLRTHEEAVRVWERLRGELFAGRRVRCSWAWEERAKLASSSTREQDKDKQHVVGVESEIAREEVRKVRETDIINEGHEVKGGRVELRQ